MSEPLQLRIDPTPNPHAVKVTTNRVITTQGKTYRGDPTAVEAPWAKALLSIPGVVGVYAINNFLSINKTPDVEWDAILPQIHQALHVLQE